MCRGGAELPILSGSGQSGEDVLIDITLRVPILHGDCVEHLHDLVQEARRGDHEGGVPVEPLDEGEDPIRCGATSLKRDQRDSC